MIYVDSSALAKLIFEEAESQALSNWLAARADIPQISSQISTIELVRTCRRRDQDAVSDARQVLAGLDLIPLASDLVEQATSVGPPELRSLNAIHLASALSLGDAVLAFVVYDARLAAAAIDAGLAVVAPT